VVLVTHPVIATSITAELTSYCEVVKRDWAWPAPAAGFAAWLYNRRNLPAPFTPPEVTALACIDDGRLGEAPVLAAYGYLLAAADEPDEGAAATWISGVARLSARDPLPGDRASFFFRPVELLGLALGAAAVTRHDTEPRRWLRQVIKDGGPRLGRDSRSVALAAYASSALGALSANAGRISSPDGSAIDLAIRWLVATQAPDAARQVGITNDPDEIETRLLHAMFAARDANLDVADAAVLYAAASSAVGTGLASTGHGRQAAVHTVVGVLRRFPAIVRELNKRHNGRTPLADIKDEYDVQDLLRGVLSGLFDDIRDEEYTPSHASLTSRVDLLLKREQIVIEAKMTRASLGQRKVAEELAIDKELYRSHPDCKTLVCFVYDPGRHLNNPTGLEDDLTDPEGPLPTVVVVAH
jgi:hypothetical protein